MKEGTVDIYSKQRRGAEQRKQEKERKERVEERELKRGN